MASPSPQEQTSIPVSTHVLLGALILVIASLGFLGDALNRRPLSLASGYSAITISVSLALAWWRSITPSSRTRRAIMFAQYALLLGVLAWLIVGLL
jgi:hypothetical protein